MTLHSGRGLTQAADNCFMHTDAADRPQYLVGVIHRQDTGDRPLPPDCLTGFDTAGTPFAKGHVMALHLGGCDQSFNIVPQYELWQANPGAAGERTWRNMERELDNGVQEVMVVELVYGAAADAYAVDQAAFLGGDRLRHWAGPDIPTRFRVWTVTVAAVAAYLAADAAGKTAGIAALIAARHGEAPFFDEVISVMPAIDRRRWKRIMVQNAAHLAHAAYAANARAARSAAIAAVTAAPAAAGGGGGAMRHKSSRLAIARHNTNPMVVPVPPEPRTYAIWLGSAAGRATVVALINNNTNNASVNWTPAERAAFSGPDVDLCFVA